MLLGKCSMCNLKAIVNLQNDYRLHEYQGLTISKEAFYHIYEIKLA